MDSDGDVYGAAKAEEENMGLVLRSRFLRLKDWGGSLSVVNRPCEGAEFILKLPKVQTKC